MLYFEQEMRNWFLDVLQELESKKAQSRENWSLCRRLNVNQPTFLQPPSHLPSNSLLRNGKSYKQISGLVARAGPDFNLNFGKKSVSYEETDIQSSHLHQKPLFAMNVVFATSKTHDWLKSFSTSLHLAELRHWELSRSRIFRISKFSSKSIRWDFKSFHSSWKSPWFRMETEGIFLF